MEYEPVVFDTSDQVVKRFESGRCDAFTGDRSQLYGQRIKLADPDKGVSSKNLEQMKASKNPESRRLLSLEGTKGKGLKLDDN